MITSIKAAGLGHRVCVDTMSMLKKGQGMLVGNSSAFTFLVHAETESNPYVAARPFRVNAGAVHAYAVMPGDRTSYLEELSSGDEVRYLQGVLAVKAHATLKVDGNFGEETMNVVIAFQGINGLPATGIVDDATWAKIDEAALQP